MNAGLGPWSVPLSDIVTTQSHSVKPELVPLCGITETRGRSVKPDRKCETKRATSVHCVHRSFVTQAPVSTPSTWQPESIPPCPRHSPCELSSSRVSRVDRENPRSASL